MMFLVVFRSSQKRDGWWKKIQQTNLDFPSVLLNQGLEANNNNFPFFHKGEGKKGKKRRKERKRDSYCVRARQETPLVNTFRHKTTARTRITQQEKQQEYNKHDHKRRDRHHTGREQTQISRNERKEKEEKHFIERERSLKSARDLDVPRQKKKFKRENGIKQRYKEE